MSSSTRPVAGPAFRSWWFVVGVIAMGGVVAAYAWDFHVHGWGMIDLDVYRWGGETARQSDELYSQLYDGFLLFTYTPFAAAVFMPMSLVGSGALQGAMSFANLAALGATVVLSMRSLGYRLDVGGIGVALMMTAAGAALEPVDSTVHFGQVNLILMAIVVGDLLLPDSSRWKGVGVGVAAGFKLTPGIFILYLLATRRIPAAVRAVVAAAGTVVVGFAILPAESVDFWFDRLFMDSERVGGVAYVANQSINGVLARLGDGGPTALWLPLGLAVGVFGLWTAARVQRRGPELAGVLVCALTGLLVSPVSWSHHWVWMAPALVLAFHLFRLRGLTGLQWAVAGIVAVRVLAALTRRIWQVPSRGGQEMHWSVLEAVQGNVFVIAGVALLVWAAWWSSVTTQPDPRELASDGGATAGGGPVSGGSPRR